MIFRLDEAAAAQARRLGRDNPALVGGGSRLQESKCWEAGHGYWHLLAAAYLDCMARQSAAGKEGDVIQSQLPLLHGRLISAMAAQLKWEQFRYGPIEREYWQTLGSVYLAAVDAKAAQKPALLYTGAAETTIEAEYLKVLVFHAASMDNLQPQGIEIAERFIA